ncbi:MAG: hypothetical protein HFACDABA_01131 [Anaerolineales bacterium]|nr:hypothetical protein [Anaerolineales bacterium]
MMKRLGKFLSPPVFEDDEQNRVAALLHPILLFLIVGMGLGLPAIVASTSAENLRYVYLLFLPVIAINILAYGLLRRGRVSLASAIVIASLGLAIFGAYAVSSYQSVGAGISFIIIIALTTLLLDGRAVAWLTAAVIVFTLAHAIAQERGWIEPFFLTYTGPVQQWVSTAFVYLLGGAMLVIATNSLQRALHNARTATRKLQSTNQSLVELSNSLEQRVNERTIELETANAFSQQRARQLEAIARVARNISAARDLHELLPSITRIISEEFGFYHVGIFLNDAQGQYAVLAASNSEGGQRMLARKHQLKIGEQGIVGNVTFTGNPRIALNVDEEAVYFNNPDLPETRSEMSLPLKASNRTFGALDVQSTEPNAFKTEDIASLSLLADQVSIAIENARLYQATRESLERSQDQYSRYVRSEWERVARDVEIKGFRFTSGTSAPLEETIALGDAEKPVREGNLYQQASLLASGTAELAVPVRLRGEVIGVLHISIPGKRNWSDDDIDIVEAVSERVALAMENARLFQSTNKRAERERVVSEIASKLSGNIRIESLLETAAQELSQALNGPEVLIQLQSADQDGGRA